MIGHHEDFAGAGSFLAVTGTRAGSIGFFACMVLSVRRSRPAIRGSAVADGMGAAAAVTVLGWADVVPVGLGPQRGSATSFLRRAS